MHTKNTLLNYNKVAAAIAFMIQAKEAQPSLFAIAAEVHTSPFHFQKIFTDWAGVSPKKFMQFLSVQHAKTLLIKANCIKDVAYETGLANPQHLHRLFVTIEAMNITEYTSSAKNMTITYKHFQSTFGAGLIAATTKGICFLALGDDEESMQNDLQTKYKQASIIKGETALMQPAINWLTNPAAAAQKIHLHVKGTAFQLQVWQALLNIPAGSLCTYNDVANITGNPKASRATGTAIGSNPVAFLIPCHRVINSTGIIGNYRWGPIRKQAIIGWESAMKHHDK